MHRSDRSELRRALTSIARSYPPAVAFHGLPDVERAAFQLELVLTRKSSKIRLCDIGGGISLFPVGCAAAGIKTTVVDDFRDPRQFPVDDSVLQIHRRHGVQLITRDFIAQGLDFPPSSFDVITTFGSFEHWHNSPRKMLAQVVECLAPNGLFVLGTVNAVNLRKRLYMPFGRVQWSSMEDWYETETFRGHVREPSVADIRYVTADMGLREVHVIGRNWRGLLHDRPLRTITRITDPLLRLRPQLCSDIYVLGSKGEWTQTTDG